MTWHYGKEKHTCSRNTASSIHYPCSEGKRFFKKCVGEDTGIQSILGVKRGINDRTLAGKNVNSKVMCWAPKSPPHLNCGLDPAECLLVSGLSPPQDDVENWRCCVQTAVMLSQDSQIGKNSNPLWKGSMWGMKLGEQGEFENTWSGQGLIGSSWQGEPSCTPPVTAPCWWWKVLCWVGDLCWLLVGVEEKDETPF